MNGIRFMMANDLDAMIDPEYLAYRKIADPLEDEYYEACLKKSVQFRVKYLNRLLPSASDIYRRVCILKLLSQDLLVIELKEGNPDKKYGSVGDIFEELERVATFDPISLISCANYYFYHREEVNRGKFVAVYAAFIAERTQVFVRHAHQTIVRIAYSDQDMRLIEVSLRRIIDYIPNIDSPDPAIERDIVEIVRKIDIENSLKEAFFKAVARQKG